MAIIPFIIDIPKTKIQHLMKKLSLADIAAEPSDAEPWATGPPRADIVRLVDYWKNKYNWRDFEAKLNVIPQFTADISVDGFPTCKVHFVHKTSRVPTAIPLLFVHGWPGSFIEVLKILPSLGEGGKRFPAFHVVAPSLVGFGFSSGSGRADFNIDQHAEVCHKLMLSLGYDEYVTQAGGLGYLVTRFMSLKYGPAHVKATHFNTVDPDRPNQISNPELFAQLQSTPLSGTESDGLPWTRLFGSDSNSYFHMHSIKPGIITPFMADSPVCLLAWIYECLYHGVENYRWTDEEILNWVSVSYFSKAGPDATIFILRAMCNGSPSALHKARNYADVAIGISRFPNDLVLLPKLWNQTLGRVVYEKDHERGGHFATWERPEAIVMDLRKMFGKRGGAFGVVTGKSGFAPE